MQENLQWKNRQYSISMVRTSSGSRENILRALNAITKTRHNFAKTKEVVRDVKLYLKETIGLDTCIPKTQFLANGKLCRCDAKGQWSKENCLYGSSQRSCIQGQVARHGCNQCICDSNGEFQCANIHCIDQLSTARKQLSVIGHWCIPLRYYKVNCSDCFCPASGLTFEASCTVDESCLVNLHSQTRHRMTASESSCIPNVMYIFPCLQCLCSDDGKFLLEKCFEVCQAPIQLKLNQDCKSGSVYRRRCNVCQCSNKGMKDDKLCTNKYCDDNPENSYIVSLKDIGKKCTPYTFTTPICLFCDCTTNGTINEESCIVMNCSTNLELKSANYTGKCVIDEVVPVCMECFCLHNGSFNEKYCTRSCNYQSKFKLLEQILAENIQKGNLINNNNLKIITLQNSCEPNSVYLYDGKYCICGSVASNFKLCKLHNDTKPFRTIDNQINSKVDLPCKPQTFVEFDCNTCYCSKTGKIDPKWCTYDDCNAKRSVQESHKRTNQFPSARISDVCTPGSISKEKCNFCICPESGLAKEKACTKNYCSDVYLPRNNVKFTCEPLAYYEVDCNVCYCPSDGLKNVAKCTKNLCEKRFLRSDSCFPGQLFSEMCNVCLCPPNGDRDDRVCTNHTCQAVGTWTNFEMSENLLEDRVASDTKRSLDLCFPGEQFTIGCKHCVCPEMGLKTYAECDASQCNNNDDVPTRTDLQNIELPNERIHARIRRDLPCLKYNTTENEKKCTPGTMYIIRCQLCICPYMGNILYFCRPLSKNFYCEQPYPYVNYEPMGRRNQSTQDIIANDEILETLPMHNHTKFACEKIGRIMDNCFVCDCDENNILIEEHCFKKQDESCANARPSFLIDKDVIAK